MRGHTALVTGANRGIGEQIAHGLARHGLSVIVGARDASAGELVSEAIKDDGGVATAAVVDVADLGSIQALAKAHPDIDVLVNNAGMLDDASLLDLSDETIVETTMVNSIGPLRLIRALAPGMAERGHGRIVNLSSGWGSLETLGPGAYGVTKAFLNAITIKVASELPASIKINAMCPGWVHTRMGGASAPRTPQEGADTAIWLATLADDGPTGGFFRDRRPISWLDG